MTEQLKPSEVLDRAADLIEPEGAWAQHRFGVHGGPHCVVGAVAKITDEAGAPRMEHAACEFVRAATGRGSLTAWNDDPARTQPDVVSALRKAAELARSEGQ